MVEVSSPGPGGWSSEDRIAAALKSARGGEWSRRGSPRWSVRPRGLGAPLDGSANTAASTVVIDIETSTARRTQADAGERSARGEFARDWNAWNAANTEGWAHGSPLFALWRYTENGEMHAPIAAGLASPLRVWRGYQNREHGCKRRHRRDGGNYSEVQLARTRGQEARDQDGCNA